MGPKAIIAALALAIGLTWLGGPVALAADPSPRPSPTSNSVCSQLPGTDEGSFGAQIGCAISQRSSQAVSGAVGQVGQAFASGGEQLFTSWLAAGAAWVVQGVSKQALGSTTTPSLDPAQAALFSQVYRHVVGVALSLSVLLVLIGIIEATLTRRPDGLRRVVTGIAISGIGLGAVPAGTAVLVRVIDDLSAYVVGGQAQAAGQGMAKVVNLLLDANPQMGTGAAFALAALGVMLGGALLWLELVVRESLIYLFLGVVPLACAAVQWPRLEGVLRQVLFAGLALILSKLVIAVSLSVGFTVLASGDGLENLLGGMFVLVIAALMPFATARILPLASEEMSLGHQGRMRGWIQSGIGTTRRIAVSAATGQVMPTNNGGAVLGSSMRDSTAQRPRPGQSGPPPSDGGRGPDGGGGGSPRPAPGRPRPPQGPGAPARRPPSSPPRPSPSDPPQQRSEGPGPQPRRGPRGPQPPRDGGQPPVR